MVGKGPGVAPGVARLMATYMHAPLIGMPRPAHATTKAAKVARRELEEWAAKNPIRLGDAGKPTRTPITRDDIIAAYVHPEPEVPQRRIVVADLTGSAKSFAMRCREAGYAVEATAWRGTPSPKWWVNAPDNPKNPGPPPHPDHYHGGPVKDFVQVWVMTIDGRRVRAVWANGRFHAAYVGNRYVDTVGEAEAALS